MEAAVKWQARKNEKWHWHRNHIWKSAAQGHMMRSACDVFLPNVRIDGVRDEPCGECLIVSRQLAIGN